MTKEIRKDAGAGILTIFANGIRHTLVRVADTFDAMSGESFKAGGQLAIEEISFRLLGEHFDQFEAAVRAEIKDEQINHLAAEFEQVLEAEVLEGRCDLIVGDDGSKRYAPRPDRISDAAL